MAKRFIGGEVVSDVAPAGSVTAFAGAVAPDGWLLCQGQELNISDYQGLYATIGTTWNTQVNPTSGSAYSAPAAGKFRLPDFRGSFLRGQGTPVGQDSCVLGTFQYDAVQNHAHNILVREGSSGSIYTDPIVTGDLAWSSSGSAGTLSPASNGGGADSPPTRHKGMNYDPRYANETRPRNTGINYLIKY